MIKYSCPSCGAEVCFRSKASVFAVCSYCKAMLVRHDMNLETIGKMADLQDDMTPLQVGTIGYHRGGKFELIGRLKVGYSDGFWNEWYALFSGDKEGWLAEAQGFYAMCLPVADANSHVPPVSQVKPGLSVELNSKDVFEIEDVHTVKCLYSEGELPMNAARGRESTSVDLTGPDNQMATIEYAKDEVRVFVGNYQQFDEFKFQNLRSLDGW